MAEIIGNCMRIVFGVANVGHILDPVHKSDAVKTGVKRHAVPFVGCVQPRLDRRGHASDGGFRRFLMTLMPSGEPRVTKSGTAVLGFAWRNSR